MLSISEREKRIVDKLLKYKEMYGLVTENAFTNIQEAENLVKNDWNAFLFAVIFDHQIRSEKAWAMPLELKERLGHLDIERIACMDDEELLEVFKRTPALHRYVSKMANWIKAACKKLINEYSGRAENIWSDIKEASEIIKRLDDFEGISQKKSTMATNFLADYFKIPITGWQNIDISVDVMIRRIFKRLGLVLEDASDDDIIKKTRELRPSFPGELDYPCWDIGRYWCVPKKPYCYYKDDKGEDNCPLANECPTAQQ